jgi:ABC transporter
MIARSSMQSRRTLSINIPVVLIITKGNPKTEYRSSLINEYFSNFTQFYSTKSERERNLRRECKAQIEYRKHLQAFIDRWLYNANRAAQVQSKIKFSRKYGYLFSTDPHKLIDCAASRAYSASGRGNREI